MSVVPGWGDPPAVFSLQRDEVHVWRAVLDRDADEVQRLARLLAEDECQRAARFHFATHRERFIVGRGLLRTLLGSYLGLPPETLCFEYGMQGKPTLASDALRRIRLHGDPGPATLRFNLSHADEIALYAVTCEREIGIDIERIRADVVEEAVAERFFSAGETVALRGLPRAQQPEAFFACWTRKEAFIKARGEGLSLPLDAFDVSLLPGEPPALLAMRGAPTEVTRWSMRSLAVDPGYAAALVVEGDDYEVQCWQVTGSQPTE